MQQRIRTFGRILKLREDARRTEQTRLVEERQKEQKVLDKLFSLEGEKHRAVQHFSSCAEKPMSCAELWMQRQFIEGIEENIIRDKGSLATIRHEISLTEERLVERHKDVRVMETYVEQLRASDFQNKIEAQQLELDDISASLYMRKKGE